MHHQGTSAPRSPEAQGPGGDTPRPKPTGRFMAMDFAAQIHSPLCHLLSILGHLHGESTVDTLTPLLKDAGFSEIEGIQTPPKNFSFIRAD